MDGIGESVPAAIPASWGGAMPARLSFYLFGAFLLALGLGSRFVFRNNKDPRWAWRLFCAAGVLFILWGACGGFYSIYLFTERIQAHRALDPDAVVAIELLPSRIPERYTSLVRQRLVVTDRQRIGQIVRALTAAEPWAANHPRTTWQCILLVEDGNGKHAYTVSSTTNNGVLITIEGGGLLLGEYREDSLKEVLEQLAREPGGG
jgi:hypothetical protein